SFNPRGIDTHFTVILLDTIRYTCRGLGFYKIRISTLDTGLIDVSTLHLPTTHGTQRQPPSSIATCSTEGSDAPLNLNGIVVAKHYQIPNSIASFWKEALRCFSLF
ncbi:hypothetical protein PIB30_075463, partial [Stylosanthes scabra]|nr:hypothetical protein [Stylosanthes scabra]